MSGVNLHFSLNIFHLLVFLISNRSPLNQLEYSVNEIKIAGLIPV